MATFSVDSRIVFHSAQRNARLRDIERQWAMGQAQGVYKWNNKADIDVREYDLSANQ